MKSVLTASTVLCFALVGCQSIGLKGPTAFMESALSAHAPGGCIVKKASLDQNQTLDLEIEKAGITGEVMIENNPEDGFVPAQATSVGTMSFSESQEVSRDITIGGKSHGVNQKYSFEIQNGQMSDLEIETVDANGKPVSISCKD